MLSSPESLDGERSYNPEKAKILQDTDLLQTINTHKELKPTKMGVLSEEQTKEREVGYT